MHPATRVHRVINLTLLEQNCDLGNRIESCQSKTGNSIYLLVVTDKIKE